MPRIEYDVVFNIQKPSQGGLGLDKSAKDAATLEKNVENAKNEINSLSKSAATTQKSMSGLSQQVGRGNKQFASANQLVFSFSDGIQDAAQFSQGFGAGMRAIGNNISFTAELLGVTARNAKQAGVSMKTALASAITPVTGGILALNVALTAGQFLWDKMTRSSKEAKNEAEALETTLDDLSKAILDLSDVNDLNTRALRRSISEQNILATSFENYANTLRAGGFNELADKYDEQAEKLRENAKAESIRSQQLIRTLQIRSQLTEQEVKFRLANIDANEAQQESIKLSAEQLDLYIQQDKVVASFSGDIDKLFEKRRGLVRLERASLRTQRDIGLITEEVFRLESRRLDNQLLSLQLEQQRMQQRADEMNRIDIGDIDLDFGDSPLVEDQALQDALTRQAKEGVDQRVAQFRRERKVFMMEQRAKIAMLNIYQDAISAAAQFGRAIFGENKALASAEALISTYVAAQKAYQSQLSIPTPDALFRAKAAAAVAVAAGLARVAAINSVTPDGGGGSARTDTSPSFVTRSGDVQPPQFTPRNDRGELQPQFVIEQTVKNSELAILVRKGNNNIRTQQVSIQ